VDIAEDGKEGVLGFRHGSFSWDCPQSTERLEGKTRAMQIIYFE
jgi:hypothetical protein